MYLDSDVSIKRSYSSLISDNALYSPCVATILSKPKRIARTVKGPVQYPLMTPFSLGGLNSSFNFFISKLVQFDGFLHLSSGPESDELEICTRQSFCAYKFVDLDLDVLCTVVASFNMEHVIGFDCL